MWNRLGISAGVLAAALLCGAVAVMPVKPKGFIGFQVMPMTKAAQARTPKLNSHGAQVVNVTPQGPADLAGITEYEVLAAIDGARVGSAREAAAMLAQHKGGDRVVLTLYDIEGDEAKPQRIALTFADARPAKAPLTVKPLRTLAKPWFNPPAMAAGASWSNRLARGASIRPTPLVSRHSGRCSGYAPDGWTVSEANGQGTVFHLASPGGHTMAIYKIVRLTAGEARDPRGTYILPLLHDIFSGWPKASSSRQEKFGFRALSFGTSNGYAGFVLYRLNANGALSMWIAGVPGSDVATLEPLAGGIVLSIRCSNALAPAPMARDSALSPYSVSTRCADGSCDEGDYAGAYLGELHLGFVHSHWSENFLIDTRRDLWATGPEGPGVYRQIGGDFEKLEAGRTN